MESTKPKVYKVLAVGGGTAGHILPLLSVMEELSIIAKSNNLPLEIHYVGLRSDFTFPELKNASYITARHLISAGKLNRYFTWNHILQAGRVFKGLAQADSLLRKQGFDLIFSKGGYVSVPVALSAAHHKIPIFAHETDLIMGLSNRIVARYAEKVFTAFPRDNGFLANGKYEQSGQPIRKEFCNPDLIDQKLEINGKVISKEKPLIVVIGGSQGSRKINMFVSGIWSDLAQVAQVVHIAGKMEYQEMRVLLKGQKLEDQIILVDYFKDIPALFAHSTLIISRSGGTIFEFACMGKASILIPLSSSAQNHQAKNAEILSINGAALMLDENAMTSDDLLRTVLEVLTDASKRQKIEQAVQEFCKPNAGFFIAKKIYDRLVEEK